MPTTQLGSSTATLAIALGIGAAITVAGVGSASADRTAGSSADQRSAARADATPSRDAVRRGPRATTTRVRTAGSTHRIGRLAVIPKPASSELIAKSVVVQSNQSRSTGPRVRTRRTRPAAATAAPTVAALTTASALASALASELTPAPTQAQSVDPINTLLNNTTPRVKATQSGPAAGGVVTGTLDVLDPDSTGVGMAVGRAPAYGTVSVTAGKYTYTADPAAPDVHTGFTDTFVVAVNDGDTGFHLHGLAGLINLLTFGLVGASGHTSSATVTVSVAPFNNAPTGAARITDSDPLTGLVTGHVTGSDPNGDKLTFLGSATPTKGTVIVGATGEFSYTPTPAALTAANAPAATAAERQDAFSVTIDDGYGGTVMVPVTVPIGRSRDVELSTFCGCTLMPADTVFHADVSGLPVLETSAYWTALLSGTLRASWAGEPWMGSSGGMPVNVVPGDRPTETVIFNRGYSTTGPGIDDRPYAIPDRPLVEGMPDVPAWDRHLLVFQKDACISQELYNVANGVELPAAGVLDALGNTAYAALYGSSWIAEAGVHVDMSSPLYPEVGHANASRLPYLPLILRPDDIERGFIDHMLGITIAKDRGTGYTWPARSGDGTGTNPDGVPMGTVLRLGADFDMTDFDPSTQVVLRALQQHGAVVYDSFGPGIDGAHLLVMSNGWTGTGHVTLQQELSTIPVTAFEAVDVLSLALDPAAGWMIRT